DGVGGGDHRRVDRVGAGRALGLHRDLVPGAAGGLLQGLGRHVGVRDAGGAGGDGDEPHGAATSRATTAAISAASGAFSSEARNSSWISRRASEARIDMCCSPPPSGAAMRKTRVASPSGPPPPTTPVQPPTYRPGAVPLADRA